MAECINIDLLTLTVAPNVSMYVKLTSDINIQLSNCIQEMIYSVLDTIARDYVCRYTYTVVVEYIS